MLQIYYVCKTNDRHVFYNIDFTLHSVTDLKCKIWLNLISCLTLFQLYLHPYRTVSKLFFYATPMRIPDLWFVQIFKNCDSCRTNITDKEYIYLNQMH